MLSTVVKRLRLRHGRPPPGAGLAALGLPAFLTVAGPGILAGLSDDDPAGITTYSIMGARFGYELLWVLLLATGALVVFHELAARIGLVTGEGLLALVRERYGGWAATAVTVTLVAANVGTTSAEFAGVAVSLELAGVGRALITCCLLEWEWPARMRTFVVVWILSETITPSISTPAASSFARNSPPDSSSPVTEINET